MVIFLILRRVELVTRSIVILLYFNVSIKIKPLTTVNRFQNLTLLIKLRSELVIRCISSKAT